MVSDLGQLIVTGISGKSLTEEDRDFLENCNIGGVILFKHNYENPAQLAELVNDIQACRSEYPLFVSVDQEGGRVKRFQTHFTQFPAMLEVASKDSPKLTFEVHKIMAQELALCGININYSPCCDVWTNPKNKVIGDRAFGQDPKEVEKHISAAIRGLHSENVLACAKHFPGHGNTAKDSHYDLPYVKKTLDELRKLEFIPFYKASKSRAEFMMMAHLVLDDLDPDLPCTLSKRAYDFLRQELKYKNIIITDDMEMKAIEDHFSTEKAAVMAIEAGADIILYRSAEKAKIAYESINEAVKTQRIKRSQIDEKVKRINRCKKTFFSEYKPIYIPDISKKLKPEGNDQILTKLI
ncbi:MAG: beta-N-acetylhexosaminidase [Bacteriovoracaceae bacterium]|jgi:beta-N-acetylhexosaminidase|nr:beta-N-acetylhexosaminidase [Bacteriovoracaceae bacterium]